MTCRVQTNRAKLCTTLISSRYGDTAYSDAIIISDTIRIPVHRFVLGSLPYFDRMLTSNMKEAVTGELVMTKTIPSFLLTNIVQFMYDGTLDISTDNVMALLHVAQHLLEDDLIEAVCSFLNEHVRQDNCLSLLTDIQPFVEMNTNDSFIQLYTSTVGGATAAIVVQVFGQFRHESSYLDAR